MKALIELYNANKRKPFAWSENDCLTWCGRCAEALTGSDPTEGLRAEYSSEASLKRGLVRHGWRDVSDAIRSLFPEIPVSKARAGDWAAVIGSEGSRGLGVVIGSRIYAQGKDGIIWLPLTNATHAFRVGA